MRIILACLALLATLAGLPAAAQPQFPPRPAGPVLDMANIIPDADEAVLGAKLSAYNQRTGRALVVATVPSLDGNTVEDYAVRLFQAWGIGGKESDSGLLLLVAPTEHKVRIEVGYGLHEYVTDILSGRIIRDQITPRFKQGDFTGGINAGIDALTTQLDRTPADAKAVTEAAAAANRTRLSDTDIPVAGFIFWVVAILFFASMFARRRGGQAYRGKGSGIGNVIMWSALNAAMNSGRSSGGGWGGGGGFGGGGGGGFGGFGGGMSGGGGASGSW